MDANPDVEAFLATVLDEVLVAADPRRLESLRGELLQLVRHKMDREGELINTSPLPSQVKDPDLGVRDTTVEPRRYLIQSNPNKSILRVVSVASKWHGFY